jgi:hypothetical protein
MNGASRTAFVVLAVSSVGVGACTTNATAAHDGGGTVVTSPVDTEGGVAGDSATTVHVVASPLPFAASNIEWTTAVDLSTIQDEDVSTTCVIRTEVDGSQGCFSSHAVQFLSTQSDMSVLHVIVVKSLRVESEGHMTFDSGGVPIAIISMGDITISGTINASNTQPVGGPGVGANATGTLDTPGTGAGGGSYCGLGGHGGQGMSASVQPGPPSAAYGSASLSPLLPGSSGGTGPAGASGGGAIELVAAGTFTMNAGSGIFANGGDAGPAGTTGQGANGGGSGGAILIEAVTVQISGTLSADGGAGGVGTGIGDGGSGSDDADDAADATQAAAAMTVSGGGGSTGAIIDGSAGGSATTGGAPGGGGGGAGRIRINSTSGVPTVTGQTFSPALGADPSSSCTTVGAVSPNKGG